MPDHPAYEGLPRLNPGTVRDYLAPWLDGALDEETAREVEALIAHDPELVRLAQQMRSLDAALPRAFDAVIQAPVTMDLVRATRGEGRPASPPMESAPETADTPGEVPRPAADDDRLEAPHVRSWLDPQPDAPDISARPQTGLQGETRHGTDALEGAADEGNVAQFRPRRRFLSAATGWAMAAAAGLLIAAAGIPLAYRTGIDAGVERQAETEQIRHGWLTQVAQYHRAYSAESRHLVEVAADESEHITDWLGARLGLDFAIPDLAAQGLDFQGARLLFIDGAPVAQLMYADAADTVIGLCFLATEREDAGFTETVRDEMGLVSWRDSGHAFVVVGPEPTDALLQIAESARLQI